MNRLLPIVPPKFLLLVLTVAFAARAAFAGTAVNAPGAPESDGVTVEAADPALDTRGEPTAQREARMHWWREAKFGLFIHWGVYAVPAGKYGDKDSYAEWIMNQAKIPVAEYQRYAQQFNPTKYDPTRWVQIAREAGMRYVVITAKHHDGFALFPSKASKWNVVDATPYGKDLLGPLVTAAHHQGLKIGFYYSQAQDWNNRGGAKSRYQEPDGWDPAQKGSFDAYLANVALPQVKELLAHYPIDILWWDTPTWMNQERAAPFAKVVAEHPRLITNNRLGGGFPGDTQTPEQFVPVTGYKGDWETCMTMNGHWGYNAADQNWKSSRDLIRKLADICAKGGNFLLNVGPTASGVFPQPCVDRLKEIGAWLRVNGEAIYGTQAGPFPSLSWGCATRRGNRLYLHVFSWPKDGQLRVPLSGASGRAFLLADAHKAQLPLSAEANRLVIAVPATAPDANDTVVVLDLAQAPKVAALPSVRAKATASAFTSGQEPEYAVDGSGERRWRAPAADKVAWLQLDLGEPRAIAGFAFDEPDVWPRLTQKYVLEYEDNSGWIQIDRGQTAGHGAKKYFREIKARKFRLTLDCPTGGPGVAELQLYSPE